jgi:MFS family permease
MLATLRRRNFALMWCAGLMSLIGDRAMRTALPFYVYQQTGATLATAALFTAAYLPMVLLGSVAGVFVDRWDRQRIMVLCLRGPSTRPPRCWAWPAWGWQVFSATSLGSCQC